MKSSKKLAALGLAAIMLVGGSLTVLAADNEGGDTGTGSYEGFVDKTSAFSVVVPTNSANTFNFFVDPNGLLAATDYARLGGNVSADSFEEGATLFFTRSDAPTYGKDSKKVELENQSSYEVNVEVSATVTGADGITLSETDELTDAVAPTLYLAIVHDTDEEAITASGGTLTGTIAGVESNFELKYNSDQTKYEFKKKESGLAAWQKYEFNLTGACGGTWTDAQSQVAPSVALTWKVTDPKAEAAPSIAKTSYTYDKAQDLSIPVSLGGGDLKATGVKSVETAQTRDGAYTAVAQGTAWDYDAGTLTFKSGQFGKAVSGDNKYVKVTFNDSAATSVVIELTIQ